MTGRLNGCLLCAVLCSVCSAQETQDSMWNRLAEDLKFNFQGLTYATGNGVLADSWFNPGNHVANISAGDAAVELRPDLRFTLGTLTFIAKPRLVAGTSLTLDVPAARSTPVDAYMQEWAVRANLRQDLMLSYGREVLQWGPALFNSPSNPFFSDNGRSNPIKEIGGRDFFRAVYTPSSRYSVSYIANTGLGRGDPGIEPFRSIQALKVDYTSKSFNLSVNASHAAHSRPAFGGYFQATVSDALLVYAEGSVHTGSGALYPVRAQNEAGWQLSPPASTPYQSTSVLGSAYTLRGGLTLTAEYLSNRPGYSDSQAREYYQMAQAASGALALGGPNAATDASLLGAALNPGLPLLRRNYLSFQFLRANFRNRADLMTRYTMNLDDGGGTLAGYATWNWTNRLQLFAVGMLNNGGRNTESGRLLRDQLFVGIRFFVK